MTVAQMLDNMTTEEYLRWDAWFADRERERIREDNRRKGVVDLTDPQGPQDLITLVHQAGG